MRNHQVLLQDREVELLVTSVGIHQRITSYLRLDIDERVDDCEASRQDGLVRLVFRIDSNHVVPSYFKLDVLVRQIEPIVRILRRRIEGVGEVINRKSLKPVHILDGRKGGARPICIAMDDFISIPREMRRHVVEVDFQYLVRAQRKNRLIIHNIRLLYL